MKFLLITLITHTDGRPARDRLREVVDNAVPSVARMSASRSSTWACTEASSAETGSSQMIRLGRGARARATATRCR